MHKTISTIRFAKGNICLLAFWLSLVIISPAHAQSDQSVQVPPPASLGQSDWQLPPPSTGPLPSRHSRMLNSAGGLGLSGWQGAQPEKHRGKSQAQFSTSPSVGTSPWIQPGKSQSLGQSEWTRPTNIAQPVGQSEWTRPTNIAQPVGQSEWTRPTNIAQPVGQSEWIRPTNIAQPVGQSEWIRPGEQSAPFVQSGQQSTGLGMSSTGIKQPLLGEVLEQEELRSPGTMPGYQGTLSQDSGIFNQNAMPMGQPMSSQPNPLETGMKALNLLMNIMPGDNSAGSNGAITMPSLAGGLGGFQSHMGGGFRSHMSGGSRIYAAPRSSLLGEIGDLAGYAARHAIRRGVYGRMYRGW